MNLINLFKQSLLEQDTVYEYYDMKWGYGWQCYKITDDRAEKIFKNPNVDLEPSTNNPHLETRILDLMGGDIKSSVFDEFIDTYKRELEKNAISFTVYTNTRERLLIRKDKQWYLCDSEKDTSFYMNEGKKKPSEGLSSKQKSAVVKKAKAGKDIGKKGKGFEKVAAKAAKQYGSKEAGERVAAAAMWKNMQREGAGMDHEVSMAVNSLKSIMQSVSILMEKLGGQERNIPGWIQDHITNAENYLDQAAQGFHEIEGGDLDEKKLTGAEKRKKEDIVKAMAKEEGGKSKLKPKDYAIATSQAIKSA